MRVLRFHTTRPNRNIGQQILQLVKENITDLSMLSVPPSNLLYELYHWGLLMEVGAYMGRVGVSVDKPVEMLVAFDDTDPDIIAGFILYSPVPTHPVACGVSYMAVKKSHRKRGIGSAMLHEVVRLFPHTELTCSIKNVSYFQSLGLNVIDIHHTQIVMNTRHESCAGKMAIVNAESIYDSNDAHAILNKLVQRWGAREMVKAEKQLDRHVDKLRQQAKTFLKNHLSETDH